MSCIQTNKTKNLERLIFPFLFASFNSFHQIEMTVESDFSNCRCYATPDGSNQNSFFSPQSRTEILTRFLEDADFSTNFRFPWRVRDLYIWNSNDCVVTYLAHRPVENSLHSRTTFPLWSEMEVLPHECDLVRAQNFSPLYSCLRMKINWSKKVRLLAKRCSALHLKERVVLREHPIRLPLTLGEGQALWSIVITS